MKTQDILTGYWHINALALIITILLIGFQILYNRNASARKQLLFLSGILLFVLSTMSPLAFLARHYLFSAHMVSHIVILLIVPPLLLSGLDNKLGEKLSKSSFRKTGNWLFSPPVAWLSGMLAMYLWHLPSLFDAMKKSSALHGIHTVSLLILGTIFIWPVYAPSRWKKLDPLQSALYLFIACVGCTILGILIAFAPTVLYMNYMPGSNTAIWSLIQNTWGISPLSDQQAGGLIMWVPACIIYITNIMVTLFGYYKSSADDDE